MTVNLRRSAVERSGSKLSRIISGGNLASARGILSDGLINCSCSQGQLDAVTADI